MTMPTDYPDPVLLAAEALRLARAVSPQLRSTMAEALHGRPGGLDLIAARLARGEITSAFIRGSLRSLLDEIDDRIRAMTVIEIEAHEHHGPDGDIHTIVDEIPYLLPDARQLVISAPDLRRLVAILEQLHDLARARQLAAQHEW